VLKFILQGRRERILSAGPETGETWSPTIDGDKDSWKRQSMGRTQGGDGVLTKKIAIRWQLGQGGGLHAGKVGT
jgi:hypothetical protein